MTCDPLLLARVLQKLAIPTVTLCAVRYDTVSDERPARAELVICTTRAWAELLAGKLLKLVAVRDVSLRTADLKRTELPPGTSASC
jgi:acetolactate synthase regulatory subunit